jgi:hypothetical protein
VVVTLDECIETCRREIAARADGFLTFRTRRAMLHAIGSTWSEVEQTLDDVLSESYQPSHAHLVRAHLAILCAKRVLPVWEAKFGKTHPHRLVDESEQLMRGSFDRMALRKDAMNFKSAALDGGAEPGPDGFGFLYAGYASAFAANVVVWDELLVPDEEEGWGQEMLDEPEDPDFFDCAAWAAAAAAGDFPWTEQKQWFSPDKSRAFWSWYLDVAVPESLKHLSP